VSDQTQTPEAAAIPTPATPAAPADVIDALFAFVEQHATNPVESMAVSYAKQYATKLAGVLGMSGTLTVRGVVDQVFSFVESKAQRPFVKLAMKGLNVLVDDVGLPALRVFLLTKGIVLPLS
jgi:hypothetical protein